MTNLLSKIKKLYPNVTTVKDATKDLEIIVTKSDAASKSVRSNSECALAHATRRILKCDGAIINVTTAYVINGRLAVRYKLPESVSREIVSFDREAGFDVGEYYLNRPAPANKLGSTRSGSRKFKKGNGKPSKRLHFTGGLRPSGKEK